MTAKEFLGQAYRLDQRINSKLQQIESLRCLTQKVTQAYGGEAVSRTRNVSSLEDSILRLMEAEEELNRQIDTLVDTKIEIGKLIDRVHNETYRLILEKRYLCFMNWDRIAEELHYSRRWVLSRHERALEVADKLLREILYEFEQDLDEFIKKNSIKLSDQEYDALIAFTYNTGSEWMRSSRLATLLINGDYSDNEFASAMGIWCHVGSSDPQISSALITRRMREVNIFLYGNYGKSGETFCAVYYNTDVGSTDVDIAFYKKGSGFSPFFGANADDDEFLYWQTEDGDTLEEGDTIDEDMTVRAVWRYNG